MKAVAIILNFFIPGVGSLVIGKTGAGVIQLIVYFVGLFLTLTLIGAIIGAPMMLGAWIWGLVTAATHVDQPVEVHVIHTNAPGGSSADA
jgi:TM2 domain-containing membrane protein YozV